MENISEQIKKLQEKYLNDLRSLDGFEALKNKYEKERNFLLSGIPKGQRPEFPIKKVDELERFIANGQEYIIRTSLTITRFEEFEKLQVKVGYGVEFRQLFQNIRKAYDHLNEQEPADAAVVLYNIMNGVKENLEDRENPVLKLCTLYICRPNEDLGVYDEELAKQKIEDWKAEQIDMNSFFSLAFNLVNGFMPIYKEVSASISSHIQNVEKEIKK